MDNVLVGTLVLTDGVHHQEVQVKFLIHERWDILCSINYVVYLVYSYRKFSFITSLLYFLIHTQVHYVNRYVFELNHFYDIQALHVHSMDNVLVGRLVLTDDVLLVLEYHQEVQVKFLIWERWGIICRIIFVV